MKNLLVLAVLLSGFAAQAQTSNDNVRLLSEQECSDLRGVRCSFSFSSPAGTGTIPLCCTDEDQKNRLENAIDQLDLNELNSLLQDRQMEAE